MPLPSPVDFSIRLARGPERRAARPPAAPPFITEEGLVLVDRRTNRDRRCQRSGKAGRSLPVAA